MSTTQLYAVMQDEQPIFIGETKNAFRGAMYVWSDIAKRYFGLDSFPHFDGGLQSRVWNASNEKPLTKSETIVLASTMDKAIVSSDGIAELLKAFSEYGQTHGHSSILEQASIIERSIGNVPDGYSVAWIQTSVCGDGWFESLSELDQPTVCDLSESFDVIKQVDEHFDTTQPVQGSE